MFASYHIMTHIAEIVHLIEPLIGGFVLGGSFDRPLTVFDFCEGFVSFDVLLDLNDFNISLYFRVLFNLGLVTF